MANLWLRKPLSELLHESETSQLKRTLSATNLVLIGIGAIIGAGLFVRTASAAAFHAGPSVSYAFLLGAVGCAFAGLCYAEFASMIPIAGSAYTYSYTTMGEFIAWIIGWDLVLEYALGAATVSIAWSEYFNKFLEYFVGPAWVVPYKFSHSPFEVLKDAQGTVLEHGMINLPALFILSVLTWVLIRGIQQSASLNGVIVVVKVVIVLLVIIFGWGFINPSYHIPYIPEAGTSSAIVDGVQKIFIKPVEGGFMGIIAAAGIVFFAFIGFDAVSTTAQEARNPKRDMPIGILGSLVICTVLYVLFSHVLTGIAHYSEFQGAAGEAAVSNAIQNHMPGFGWLAKFVTVAILFGFSSVIMVMLLGQSRVFYSMSKDGLVPKVFSELHPEYKTPYRSNQLFLIFVSVFAAFIPGNIVGDMVSIGTLFAFVLVCIGIIIMRRTNPDTPRPFKTPWVPFIPILGIAACALMIYGLGIANWSRLIVWLLIGFVFYFTYGIKNSKVQQKNN